MSEIAARTLLLGFVLSVLILVQPAMASIEETGALANTHDVIIDVGSTQRCRETTLPGAYCLPLDELLAPNSRIPNFSGLLWLWGTIGLSGDEHVLLVGDSWKARMLAAGLLHLSGQAEVSVLNIEAAQWSSAGLQTGTGRMRSTTRQAVYQSPMRAAAMITRQELQNIIHTAEMTPLLDGRTESEYWGKTLHAMRGGHLPGAILSPLAAWRSNEWSDRPEVLQGVHKPVVYAHDSASSILFYALLASKGIESTVLLGGWSGWANDGSLPVDAEVFPGIQRITEPAVRNEKALSIALPMNRNTSAVALVVAVLSLVIAVIALVLATRTQVQKQI